MTTIMTYRQRRFIRIFRQSFIHAEQPNSSDSLRPVTARHPLLHLRKNCKPHLFIFSQQFNMTGKIGDSGGHFNCSYFLNDPFYIRPLPKAHRVSSSTSELLSLILCQALEAPRHCDRGLLAGQRHNLLFFY